MDSTKLAISILSAPNSPIPAEVATELLSMVPSDQLPNSLLNFGAFDGPNAANVARSCPKKAKLLTAHTKNQDVHRAVFESLLVQVAGMDAALNAGNITDEDLLIDIHHLVWEDRYAAHDYANARNWIVDVVPLWYQLEFLVEGDLRKQYPLDKVGNRIGKSIAAGEFACLEHVNSIAQRYLTPTSDTQSKELLRSIGLRLGFEAVPEPTFAAVEAIEEHLEPKWADEVITTMCERIKLLDERLLDKVLRYMPTPEEFHEAQLRSMSSYYTGSTMQVPRELAGRDLRFTMPALRRIAETFPAALLETVRSLKPDQEGCEEIIDLALGSNLTILAHQLLNPPQFNAVETKAVMTPEQFRRALAVHRSGRVIERDTRPRPELNMASTALSIPAGTALGDVVELFGMVPDPDTIFGMWLDPSKDENLPYQPDDTEYAALLAALDPSTRLKVLGTAMHRWGYLTGGEVNPELDRRIAARVHLTVDSCPVADLVSVSNGPRYLAHVFSREFAGNIDQWRAAIGLAPSATVPLSKLVAAAKRLG